MNKSKIFQLTIKIVGFICICLALNFFIFDNIHSYTKYTLGELERDADKVQLLFLGSSQTYRGIDPETIDDITGLYSFNAGTSQQEIKGAYYILKNLINTYDNKSLKAVF